MRPASLAHCLAHSGSLWLAVRLILALSGSLSGSLWLSLDLSGLLSGSLWLPLALSCSLRLSIALRICLQSPRLAHKALAQLAVALLRCMTFCWSDRMLGAPWLLIKSKAGEQAGGGGQEEAHPLGLGKRQRFPLLKILSAPHHTIVYSRGL